jgi:hypothetical protein
MPILSNALDQYTAATARHFSARRVTGTTIADPTIRISGYHPVQQRNTLGVTDSSGTAPRTVHLWLGGVSLATRPRVSLVIAATGGGAQSTLALDAALPVCRELQVELLLVRAGDPVALHRLPDGVRVVPAAPDVPLDGYRALGLQAASGDIVLLTSDTDAVGRDWQSILVHRLGLVAESGSGEGAPADPTPASHGNPVA